MSVLIQVGTYPVSQLAKFEDSQWVRVRDRYDARLTEGLNELLRQAPIPEDCPDADRYALDMAKGHLPDLMVLHFGPEEEINPAHLPLWLRFLLGR
jgi:hypothetical protein